tara:strand:+ start:73 stop:762 length:690 start_codon:yes stop_codon:yes gene_type:complete
MHMVHPKQHWRLLAAVLRRMQHPLQGVGFLTDWIAQELELVFVLSKEFTVWHLANRFTDVWGLKKEAIMDHSKKERPGWAYNKNNIEIDAEFAELETAKGLAFLRVRASLAKRVWLLAKAAHFSLLESGFHDDTHPLLLRHSEQWLVEPPREDLFAEAPVGRPAASALRNKALVKAVAALAKAGYGVGAACEHVAHVLATNGVDGHKDNLSGRTVQAIYQKRDKSNDEQ